MWYSIDAAIHAATLGLDILSKYKITPFFGGRIVTPFAPILLRHPLLRECNFEDTNR